MTRFMKIEAGNKFAADMLAFMTALFIAKASFPLLEPIWYITLAISVFFSLIALLRRKSESKLYEHFTINVYFPLILVFLLFLIAIHKSSFETFAFEEELINLGVIVIFLLMFTLLLPTYHATIRYRNSFFRILSYLALFISLAGLTKFLLYLMAIELPSEFSFEQMSLGTSLILNTDVFIAAIVAAMIGVMLLKFRQKNGILMDILYHLSLLVMFYTVIWSGSKKGLIMMILLFISVVVLRIFFLIHKSRGHNYNLIRNLNIIILVIGFSVIIGTWAINFVNGEKKENWITELGFNSYHFKSEMTIITFAHLSTFYEQADLQGWYDRLWGSNTDDHSALKDKINFVLVEQENIAVMDQPGSWTSKAYDFRKQRWANTWELFNSLPLRDKLLGVGFGYLEENMPVKSSDRAIFAGTIQFKNNFLISALMYSGITGLLVLLWLLFQAGRICYLRRDDLLAVMVIYGVILILYLLSHNTILTNPLLLVMLIIPMKFASFIKQDASTEKITG